MTINGKPILICLLLALSPACASVNVRQLKADGTTNAAAAEGFRYYQPRPYLLVMALPPATASTAPAAPGGESKDPGKVEPGKGDSGKSDDSATASQSAAGDSGFLAISPSYVAKIVYLPDYSKPMAVQMSSGLLGTASVQLGMQNGWMLNSASINSDNTKLADSVDSIVGALAGLAGGGGGGGSKKTSDGAPGSGSSSILRPGLYRFDFNSGGEFSGLCAVSFFTSNGLATPPTEGTCMSTPPPEQNPK